MLQHVAMVIVSLQDKEEKLSLLENISTLREKMKMLKESKMQKLDVYQSILASCKINAFEETKKDKTLKGTAFPLCFTSLY